MYRGLQVLFCLCYHLSELDIGVFLFSGEVEELLVVGLGLLLVLEKIGIGIGNIIIGGDGRGVIGQVFLPCSNGLLVMLRQIVAFSQPFALAQTTVRAYANNRSRIRKSYRPTFSRGTVGA